MYGIQRHHLHVGTPGIIRSVTRHRGHINAPMGSVEHPRTWRAAREILELTITKEGGLLLEVYSVDSICPRDYVVLRSSNEMILWHIGEKRLERQARVTSRGGSNISWVRPCLGGPAGTSRNNLQGMDC